MKAKTIDGIEKEIYAMIGVTVGAQEDAERRHMAEAARALRQEYLRGRSDALWQVMQMMSRQNPDRG